MYNTEVLVFFQFMAYDSYSYWLLDFAHKTNDPRLPTQVFSVVVADETLSASSYAGIYVKNY